MIIQGTQDSKLAYQLNSFKWFVIADLSNNKRTEL